MGLGGQASLGGCFVYAYVIFHCGGGSISGIEQGYLFQQSRGRARVAG